MKTKPLITISVSLLIATIPFSSAMQVTLKYDNNGNLITGDGKYREYNEFNQLVRVRAGSDTYGRIMEEYQYHPTEERILSKKVYDFDQNLKETVIYVNDNLIRTINSSGTYDTVYVKDESGIVAEKKSDGTNIYYHNDHLGSTSLTTDQSGAIVEETFYAPYGQVLEGGQESRYDYEGKELSKDTEDYDFHFRKYDAWLTIFTQPDNTIAKGYGEKALNKLKADTIIQFERFGFVRLDKKTPNKLIFWFTHK